MERTNEIKGCHDLIGPLHWFPVATDRLVGLSLEVERGVYLSVVVVPGCPEVTLCRMQNVKYPVSNYLTMPEVSDDVF